MSSGWLLALGDDIPADSYNKPTTNSWPTGTQRHSVRCMAWHGMSTWLNLKESSIHQKKERSSRHANPIQACMRQYKATRNQAGNNYAFPKTK